jgi:hypothetical protein
LKYIHVDAIHINCMRVDTCYDGPNYLVCGSIEEYVRYEQHRSNVTQQVLDEDMKGEKREYGNMVTVNYVSLRG